jgi:VIT1/CCC1 family predicted Fe2+/Mn2+ transporter
MAKLTRMSYGGTAAIVTSMGVVSGLSAVVSSRAAVISSLLVIALADNLTDSLAIHIYQESEKLEARQAFRSTVSNFFVRLTVAMSFVLLALLLPPERLAPFVIAWGMLLLSTITFLVARERGVAPFLEVLKHLAAATLVIAVSKAVGAWIEIHVH